MENWKEKLNTYETAERVMTESRRFYSELINEPLLTRETAKYFNNVREMAEENPSIQKIIDEMQVDVQEKRYFSSCLEI